MSPHQVTEPRRAEPEDFQALFEDHVLGPIVLTALERRFALPPRLDGTQDGLLLTTIRAAQREVLDWIHGQIARAGQSPAEQRQRSETPEASIEPTTTFDNGEQ